MTAGMTYWHTCTEYIYIYRNDY